MKRIPDAAECEICHDVAVVHVRDVSDGTDHLYCAAHEPDLRPGRNRDLKILRHRLAPGNSCSRSFAAPLDSTDHEMFRTEMCDVRLLGTDGACRYYLSRITGVDHFALWSDEYLENLREFADQKSDGAANAFRIDQDTVGVIFPLLKSSFFKRHSDLTHKITKEDRAVELLLRNPRWSDARIAKNVPTTTKQLERFTTYQLLLRNRIRSRAT